MTPLSLLISNKTVLVDIEDLHLLQQCSAFDITKNGYVRGYLGGLKKTNYLHRIVMSAIKGDVVDHINGDKLDNRKSNLRFVTRSQSQMNRGLCKVNVSGIIGVSKHPRNSKKWTAQIQIERKGINLGSFDSKEFAAECRKVAEERLFGEYARSEK